MEQDLIKRIEFLEDKMKRHQHLGFDLTTKLTPTESTGGGGAKSVTFIVGPASNSDSDTYDYTTTGTNDNVPIQAAIDALPSTGGEVKLREGTYTLGSASVVVAKNGVTLSGVGKGSIVTCKTDFNSSLISMGHASNSYSNCRIADIKFDGNASNQSTSGTLIDNDTLTNAVSNVLIENCTFENAKTYGIVDKGNAQVICNNSFSGSFIFFYTANGGSGTIYGNYLNQTGNFSIIISSFELWKVTNNTASLPNSYSGTYAFGFANVSGNTISVGSSAQSDCQIFYICPIVVNNFIDYGSSTNPDSVCMFVCYQVDGNTIFDGGTGMLACYLTRNNRLSRLTGHGINPASIGYATITDNFVNAGSSSSSYHDIYLQDSLNTIVNGNRCTGRDDIVEDGGADYNIITSNIVSDEFTSGTITIVGANTISANNITT